MPIGMSGTGKKSRPFVEECETEGKLRMKKRKRQQEDVKIEIIQAGEMTEQQVEVVACSRISTSAILAYLIFSGRLSGLPQR